ncbi:N-acetylglucosamine related transporter, NagX [Leifsonia rubra CMS 76R]|nr:N-acetylglucosamine related transporter, NagX [Leifsonia rubra CMS 76R]
MANEREAVAINGPTTATQVRIDALDWARGWMLVASLGVNSAIISIPLLAHAPWASIMPIDLIFPLFVTLAGCGMSFAFHRRVEPWGVLRRALVLVALGLGYNAIVNATVSFSELRFTGVLQLYAVVIVVMALMHLVTRSWRGWALLTILLAVAHTAMLSIFARSCVATLLTPECNPSGPLDSLVFGASHIYRNGLAGHDPEGIVAIMGALVSTAAGATLGHLILRFRRDEAVSSTRVPITTVPIVLAIAALLGLALVLWIGSDLLVGGPVPPMKRLWTAPFALGIAAIAALLLWLGQLALPSSGLRTERHSRVWMPWVALGRNSLLAYFGSHLLMSLLNRSLAGGPSVTAAFASLFPSTMLAQLGWTALWLAFWVALAMVLHRRGWYVKP